MRTKGLGWALVAIAAVTPFVIKAVTAHRHRPVPVEPVMANAGEQLFKHVWTPGDPLAGGDGLGPVYNADSCVACHFKGGVGGSGEVEQNVTTFIVRSAKPGEPTRQGVVHSFSTLTRPESLQDVHTNLPAFSRPKLEMILVKPRNELQASAAAFAPLVLPQGVHLSQRNTPALFGAKLIDEIPESQIIANERREQMLAGLAPPDARQDASLVNALFPLPAVDAGRPVGRVARLPDGKIGRFGWKAQSASLASFVRSACANELGLGNPTEGQPRPLFLPGYEAPALDLTDAQCDQLTAFVASLPRPQQATPAGSDADAVHSGKRLFSKVGCADCHTPDLGGVKGLYSDLLLHRMGAELEGGGSYNQAPEPIPDGPPGDGPSPSEWRTPPLWGVADSAPYLHDGRAATLPEAIQLHGGQAAASAERYARLSGSEQAQLVAFLQTLRAPGERR